MPTSGRALQRSLRNRRTRPQPRNRTGQEVGRGQQSGHRNLCHVAMLKVRGTTVRAQTRMQPQVCLDSVDAHSKREGPLRTPLAGRPRAAHCPGPLCRPSQRLPARRPLHSRGNRTPDADSLDDPNPRRLHKETRWSKLLATGQALLLVAANGVALVQLIILLTTSDSGDGGARSFWRHCRSG